MHISTFAPLESELLEWRDEIVRDELAIVQRERWMFGIDEHVQQRGRRRRIDNATITDVANLQRVVPEERQTGIANDDAASRIDDRRWTVHRTIDRDLNPVRAGDLHTHVAARRGFGVQGEHARIDRCVVRFRELLASVACTGPRTGEVPV